MEQEVQEEVRDDISYDEPEATQEPEEAATDAATDEPEQPAETAEEERKRVEFSEEQQKYINEHIVARQVAKRKEVERELEELRQRAQQPQQQQDNSRPRIPDPPNVWDDNYEQKIQERDRAIQEAAAWDAREQARQEYEQQQQYVQQQQEQQQLLERVSTYTNRAKENGIDEADLQVAGNAVAQYGIPDDLIQYILDDDAGPAITMHLSRNLQTLDELNRMNPLRAAAFIEREIKPRAARNLKRRNAPPEPADNPKGSGVPEKERGPAGAVYE